MQHLALSIRSLVVATCACSAVGQEATFAPLGLLSGGRSVGSLAMAVSDDGRAVAGTVVVEDPLDIIPFIWTEATGMLEIDGRPPDVLHTLVHDVSADGSLVAGRFWLEEGRDQAFLWMNNAGYTLLPSLPGEALWSTATAISRDGKRIFGDSGAITEPQAVIWDHPFDAPRGLGGFPGSPVYSWLTSATPDGLAAGGAALTPRGLEAVLWREGEGFMPLGDLAGGRFESVAFCISADAGVLTGTSNTTGAKAGAFRWTEATGMAPLGVLPGLTASGARATTADGAVIVGASDRLASNTTAFIWDRIHGMRDLTLLLEDEYGLDLDGWQLKRASDITPDGRFIVGQGRSPTGVFEAYRIQIPAFCYADCDDSSGRGELDFFDFLEFQRRFALQDAYSDCDENGAHDFFDFLCFQNHFVAGCL